MKDIRHYAETYRKRFKVGDSQITSEPNQRLSLVLVIPAYNEDLEPVLKSLEGCDLLMPEKVEVIIVLNHSLNSNDPVKDRHQKQARMYDGLVLDNELRVHTMKSFDLNPKTAGVGLARKTGMDEALIRFSSQGNDGLIVCLDADCQVSGNYIGSLLEASGQNWNTLSIYYEHPVEHVKDEEHRGNIIAYEIFLRYYALALDLTSYPYPFQTVGSSMAVRASLYAQSGGMNTRKAGEDFYFLHKVFPKGRVKSWNECTVYPSPRYSDRVPFGTGRAMLDSGSGVKDYSLVYDPEIFHEIRKWLLWMEDFYSNSELPPGMISIFLIELGWDTALRKLKDRSTTAEQFRKNFRFWCDGFKILKLVHLLDEKRDRTKSLLACRTLLNLSMDESITDLELLYDLRRIEKEREFIYI